ncbi:unnamed protein product [Merluccius merluccius]
MTAAALIGDQLILEEDYDENYTPSEQEIHEYAREIGIDPDRETDLLWLAREGIVAPLPREWKPCQDVTGDVYYFNFSTGQSTWDHPCDEHYRGVVTQERQRALLAGTGAAGVGSGGKKETKEKKKKKEKKEKKEKKKKEPLMAPGPLSAALPSPLGSLAPLRGLDVLGAGPIPSSNPPLRGLLGSSGGLEPLKTSLGALRSSGGSSVLGSRQEERVSRSRLGREDQDNLDAGQPNSGDQQSACGSAGLLRNLYLDLDALGGGLHYEDSEASGGAPLEEHTEPELQDLALSGDQSPEPPSQQDSLRGRHLRPSPLSPGREEEGDGVGEGSQASGSRHGVPYRAMTEEEQEEAERGGEEEKEEEEEEEEGGKREAESEVEEDIDQGEEEEMDERAEKAVKKLEEDGLGEEGEEVDDGAEGEKEKDDEINDGEGEKAEVEDPSQGEDTKMDDRGVGEEVEATQEEMEDGERGEAEVEEERIMGEEGDLMGRRENGDDEGGKEESKDGVAVSVERGGGKTGEEENEEEEQNGGVWEEEEEVEVVEQEGEEGAERRNVQRQKEGSMGKGDGEKGGEEEEKQISEKVEVVVHQEEGGGGEDEERAKGHGLSDVGQSDEEVEEVEEDIEEDVEVEEEEEIERYSEKDYSGKNDIARETSASEEDEDSELERFIVSEEEEEMAGQMEKREEEQEGVDDEGEGEKEAGRPSEREEEEEEEGEEERWEDFEGKGKEEVSVETDRGEEDEDEDGEEVLERNTTSKGEAEPEGEGSDRASVREEEEEVVVEQSAEGPRVGGDLGTPNKENKAQKNRVPPLKSPLLGEESVASEQIKDVPSSIDDLKSGCLSKMSEKTMDPKDLSPAISPLDTDEGKEEEEEEEEESEERELSRKRNSTGRRLMQAAAVDSSPARQVDRLVLHHSSPSHSLSSPSHSGRDAGPRPKAEGLSTSLALQRPETSRGRLARATNTQQREVESPTRELGGPPAEELSWKTQRTLRGEGKSGEAVEDKEVKIGELRKKEEREEERRRKMEEEEWGKEVKERERHHEETEMEKRNVDREVEEEKKRASLEKERRLCLLQEELRREEEEEERRLKQESEERVRAVCQRLDCERSEEETRLREESNRKLKELRESGQRERENQHRVLREEGEATINDLRATLDEEHAAERDRLEARRRLDLENLKVELEAEIQAERRRLLGEKEEKLSSLRQELADVLQEVREEVQRDHDRKLEQLKEEHRRELNTIREKHLDEESAQRERLLCALHDDRERLQSTHTVQLEKLRLELDAQTQRTRLAHTRRECELQEQLEQLEVKTKDLKTQEVLLQTKAADLKRRRKRLGEEEEEVDRGIEQIEQLKEELGRAREEKRRAQREADGARGERDTAREESRRAQEERDRLELKVEVLQERCARLSRRFGEPEQGDRAGVSLRPQPRQEKKKAEKRAEEAEEPAAPSSDGKIGSLHMDDLEEPPLSPTPDSQSSLDDMHCYISTEEASVHKARQFLERESQRQAVLQAAGPVPFASNRSLDAAAEARQLDLRRALQQGSVLLQQLESSMAQEPLLEELSRMAAERKVTFDVTDSDLSSTLDPQDGPGDHPTVPAKIQQLSESLQQISGQLNMVLGALGSLGQPSASTATQASGGVPPTSSSPLSAGPPWAWGGGTHRVSGATPLFATPIAGTRRASGDLLNSRWAKLFPGAPVDPVASSTLRTGSAYSSFTPASESARSLHSMPKTFEMDGQRLQGLIDGNKRWLEMRRKDASIPLFTRYRPPAAGGTGLVQLGLDDNNQIKVYHY